jgi:hypothetical protein
VGEDRTPPVRRTTVAEAAEVLGISAEAVRGRIRRGTLPVEREGGTVYVLLSDQGGDRTIADQSPAITDRTDLLIVELQDRVRSLEEANRENRRIIAALTQWIPELPPSSVSAVSQEPSESPTEATGQPGRVEPPVQGAMPEPSDALGGPGSETARGFWWSRIFGG